MSEKETWHPSIEQQIEAKLGNEFLENAEATSREIFKAIKIGLADIGLQPGSTEQQRKNAEKYLKMWRELANSLYSQTTDSNIKSHERVNIAIEGASALLSPESTREDAVAARNLVKALGERFS